MLLQKLQGHDAVIDGAIMYELADLARIAEVTTFGDIVKAIFDIGRRQSNDEEIERAVSSHGAQCVVQLSDLTSDDVRFSLPSLVLLLPSRIDRRCVNSFSRSFSHTLSTLARRILPRARSQRS